VILFVAVVATTICCFLCSCCYLYRRRQHLQSPFEGTGGPGHGGTGGKGAGPCAGHQTVPGRAPCVVASAAVYTHLPVCNRRDENVPGPCVNSGREYAGGHACM